MTSNHVSDHGFEFWTHFQTRGLEIRSQMITTITWSLGLLVLLVGYILTTLVPELLKVPEFSKTLDSAITSQKILIWCIFGLSVIGGLFSAVLEVAFEDFKSHMQVNYDRSDAVKVNCKLTENGTLDGTETIETEIGKAIAPLTLDDTCYLFKRYLFEIKEKGARKGDIEKVNNTFQTKPREKHLFNILSLLKICIWASLIIFFCLALCAVLYGRYKLRVL